MVECCLQPLSTKRSMSLISCHMLQALEKAKYNIYLKNKFMGKKKAFLSLTRAFNSKFGVY